MKCPTCQSQLDVKLAVKLDVKPQLKPLVKSSVKFALNEFNGERETCVKPKKRGGRGGVSSLSLSSSSPLLPESDPISQVIVTPERARAEGGRPSTTQYTQEFESLWALCAGKKGNKKPAFNSFIKFNPPVELVVSRWREWKQTSQWLRGFSPHLSTWLNQAGWENGPHPDDMKDPTNGSTSATRDASRRFLDRHGDET